VGLQEFAGDGGVSVAPRLDSRAMIRSKFSIALPPVSIIRQIKGGGGMQ